MFAFWRSLKAPRKANRRRRSGPFRTCLERLEDRLVLSALLSVNTAGTDSGNNASGDANFFTLPMISDDGNFVAFYSKATNISPEGGIGTASQRSIHVRDRLTNTTDLILSSSAADIPASTADVSLSADGRFVAFTALTRVLPINPVSGLGTQANGIYLTDRLNGTTRLISNDNAVGLNGLNEGASQGSVISPDGRFVAFLSLEASCYRG